MGSDFSNNNDVFLKLLKQAQSLGSNPFAASNPVSNISLEEAQSNYFIDNPAQNPDFIGPIQIISNDDEQMVLDMLQAETEEYVHPFLIKEKENEDKDVILDAVGVKQTTEVISAAQMYFNHIDKVLQKYFPNMSEEELSQLSEADIEKAMLIDSMTSGTVKTVEMVENYFNTEGIVDHGYNWIKDLLNLGLTKDDIIRYVQNEELKNQILASALTNGSVEVVDNIQGLSDEELLTQGLISKEKINSIVEDKIANATSIEEIVGYCTSYLGMNEENIITLMKEHYSQAETQKYLSTMRRASQLDAQLGLNINIEITKGEDGEYYLSSNDSRSSLGNKTIPFDEYIKMNDYTSDNISKGQFSVLAEKIAQQASLKELNFDEMYVFLTGAEYNPETIARLNEITPAYQYALSKYVAAEQFEAGFQSFDSPTQVVQYYQQMLGCSKEEAINAFNQYYANNLPKINNGEGVYGPYGKCSSFALSEDGKTLIEQYELSKEQYDLLNSQGMLFGEYNENTATYMVSHSVEILDSSIELNIPYLDNSIFKALNSDINKQNVISNQAIADYNDSEYAQKFGTFEEINERYPALFKEAYGQNVLNDKFTIYQNDMDTYASKLASNMSMIGLGLSFFNPALGIISLVGSFSDNGMDLLNLATNKTDDEFGAWSKQFAKEAVAFTIGYGLGSMAGKFGDGVCAKILRGRAETSKLPVDELFKTAKSWGTAAEAVMDFGLSYPADVLYEAMLTGEFNWEGNLFGNILGSAMDIKGGIGAYRAFKGGKTDFDYTFNDGTQVTYSKNNGLNITDAKGNANKYGWVEDKSDAPRARDLLITPENAFDPNDISASYNRMMYLNYANEEIESVFFNHLRTIPELVGMEDHLLRRICQTERGVSRLIAIKDNSRALEIFNNLMSNPKLKPLIDDYKISVIDILDFTDLSDIELSHLDKLLENESIIKYLESFEKKSSERDMFNTIFCEDFKNLVQLPENSFKNLTTLLEIPTIAKLLAEDKLCLFNLEDAAKNQISLGNLKQLFEIASVSQKLENNIYTLEELLLISKCNDRVFGKFLNSMNSGNTIAKNSFEYMKQAFDLMEPDIANKVIELYCSKACKIKTSIFEVTGEQKVSQNIIDDINKIYDAYLNGQSIKDAFIPTYDSFVATLDAKVGDVYEVEGDLYIKIDFNTSQKLHISKDTYYKLFPPIDRYYARQGQIGDCYLVSALYAMYENPATRANILSCFSENPNGEIIVKLPNSNSEFKFSLNAQVKDSVASVYDKIDRKTKKVKIIEKQDGSFFIAASATGYQMLEETFGLEAFRALVDKKFKKATDWQEKLLNGLSSRAVEYVLKQNRTALFYDVMLKNGGQHANTLRGNGGKIPSVVSIFGIKDGTMSTQNKKFAETLQELANDENAIIMLSSYDKYDDTHFLNENLRIVGNHAYALKIEKDENGAQIYKLINPHDTSKYTIITQEDIVEYFSHIHVGNVRNLR